MAENPSPAVNAVEHPADSSFDPHPPTDLKSRLKASYDAIAPRYNEWTVPHSSTRLHYLDQLLDRVSASSTNNSTTARPPFSILELGCGAGVPVTQTLLSHPELNISVTANDLSSAQIDFARANLRPLLQESPEQSQSGSSSSRLTLLEGDMLTLNFQPGSFDGVVAMYSVIHLPRDEQVEMLRLIATWLKPGTGWLLANFGAEESKGSQAEKWLGEEEGWMFWSGWGVEGTLGKVRSAGLEVVVSEVKEDVVDQASFLWVLARRRDEGEEGDER